MLLALYTALTVSMPVTPDINTSARFAGDRHALVSVFPGPVAEGDTSQGLEAAPWFVWQAPNKTIRIAKAGGQSNGSPEVFGLENWTTNLDRISLAFDQNGRRVIALSQGGTVGLSRVLPGPVENRVTWAGVDCLLWFDGLLRDVAGGEPTDVIAFYLPVTRDSIKFRIQSENYAIERTYTALPKASSLDALALSQNRLVLYPTAQDGTTANVVSSLYPIRAGDAMTMTASLFAGSDFQTVTSPDPITGDTANMFASIVSGVDYSPLVLPDPNTGDALAMGANVISGLDLLVVFSPDADADAMTMDAAIISGLDDLVLITADPLSETMTVSASIFSGSIT